MSREGLSLDLLTEDILSHAAHQFSAIDLNGVDTSDNNNIPSTNVPLARRLRRCSSLKSGKSPPGTPSSKKIVRFADVMGLDLADVRTYLDEIPQVPASAYDDLGGLSDEEEEETCDHCDNNQSEQSPAFPGNCPTNANFKFNLVALFNQPGYEPNFFQLLNKNKVCLEKVLITQYYDGHPVVSGTVRVRNEHFNKQVYVRYTTDQWQSNKEVLAKYIDNSSDGYSDKFSFVLYTHAWDLCPLKTVAMCFRYETNGQEYWDNNCGKNYMFQCHITM